MIDSLLHRDPSPGAALGAAPAGPVRIAPNRRQIDRRFPVLGFTVDAGGLPWFEVLLTTDRTLFDPANAGRRSPANFYASRQDSGLIQAEPLGAVYVAPMAVVHAFAGAVEICYTAIAYRGRDGSGPAFAMPPQQLPGQAPAVSVSPDLRRQTGAAASVLSVPLEKLSRLRADGSLSALAVPEAPEAMADPDSGEDEDLSAAAAEEAAALADCGWGAEAHSAGSGDEDGYDDGYEASADEAAGLAMMDEAQGGAAQDEEDPYGDGAAMWSDAQESTFPAGAQAPPMLEDEDETTYGAQEQAYGNSYGEDGDYDDGFGASEEEPASGGGYDEAAGYELAAGGYGEPYGEDEEPEAAESLAAGDEELPPYEALEAPEADEPAAPIAEAAAAQPLTIPEKRRILEQVAPFESGPAGYAAINADGEFEGRFGNHPARQHWHVGLSYGVIQFTQDSGSLGRLLQMMQSRDAGEFGRVFGPQADELVRVTNAAGPSSAESPGGRSARVQPVGGADLWREPWLARFRQAATHVPFQAAQNELAATLYLEPVLPLAAWLGLDTDRALAMVVDRAVQMGVGGARRWIVEAVGPVQSTAQRQQCLAALGHADLTAFQKATRGLTADGDWGPLTHAALVAALRQLGSRSPVPIPTRDQMMDAMVRRAAGTPWEKRTAGLRRSTTLTDVVYAL
ncbi:MAG: hypothetical protein ABUT39_28355 [Acidobacteriota bacterium]